VVPPDVVKEELDSVPNSLRQVTAETFKGIVHVKESGPECLEVFGINGRFLLENFQVELEDLHGKFSRCLVMFFKTISDELPVGAGAGNLGNLVEQIVHVFEDAQPLDQCEAAFAFGDFGQGAFGVDGVRGNVLENKKLVELNAESFTCSFRHRGEVGAGESDQVVQNFREQIGHTSDSGLTQSLFTSLRVVFLRERTANLDHVVLGVVPVHLENLEGQLEQLGQCLLMLGRASGLKGFFAAFLVKFYRVENSLEYFKPDGLGSKRRQLDEMVILLVSQEVGQTLLRLSENEECLSAGILTNIEIVLEDDLLHEEEDDLDLG